MLTTICSASGAAIRPDVKRPARRGILGASVLVSALFGSTTLLQALPTITSVVETGGDDSANTPAQFTGQTFNHPNLGEITVGTFAEDAPTYRDRTHQWNGATADLPLPSYLAGGEYIMIRNDNRDNADFKLEVTVSEEALVYVLVDNRLTDSAAGDPPESGSTPEFWTRMLWLSTEGFVPVLNGLNRTADATWPDEIGVDESGDGTGAGQAINNYSSVYFKQVPAGTFTLGEMNEASRNMYGVVVKRLPQSINNPPEIVDVVPTNNAMFYVPASGLKFGATTIAPNRIDAAGLKLTLNGADVSGALVVGGTATARTAQFNGLLTDTLYRARISVSDQAGRTSTRDFTFDTFSTTTTVTIEAEDYNYDGGKLVAGTPPAGYAGLLGIPDVDYHDGTVTAAADYRNDYVGLAVAGDVPRSRFTDASATDYQVTAFRLGDWMNYTRSFGDQAYVAYLRVSGSAAQSVRLDRVTGDASTANQATVAMATHTVGTWTTLPMPATATARSRPMNVGTPSTIRRNRSRRDRSGKSRCPTAATACTPLSARRATTTVSMI